LGDGSEVEYFGCGTPPPLVIFLVVTLFLLITVILFGTVIVFFVFVSLSFLLVIFPVWLGSFGFGIVSLALEPENPVTTPKLNLASI
jgi:hypothetical protein